MSSSHRHLPKIIQLVFENISDASSVQTCPLYSDLERLYRAEEKTVHYI